MDTTDPAPAPIASKEPEKGKRYFGLYLLVGGRKPLYDMESDIETSIPIVEWEDMAETILSYLLAEESSNPQVETKIFAFANAKRVSRVTA